MHEMGDERMKQNLLSNLCEGSPQMKGLINLTHSKSRFQSRVQPSKVDEYVSNFTKQLSVNVTNQFSPQFSIDDDSDLSSCDMEDPVAEDVEEPINPALNKVG